MEKLMKPFIENIVDVKGNKNCGFWTLVEHMGLIEENHSMVRKALIKEVKDHMSDYMKVFRSNKCFSYILNDLYPS
jgi:hypothetical protein